MPLRRQKRFVSVERSEVDGVPVFWGDGPPPFVATIVFRVGRADETLATGGLTHLVEHLAIPATVHSGIDVNGVVTAVDTMFWVSGSRERALRTLGEILRGLGELPLERLETERRILRTEAASFSSNPVIGAAAFHFGAKGAGLGFYDELGLNWVEADDVERWWRLRFTAENAAIWMTGRPPGKFEVPLLHGEKNTPTPVAPIADLPLPAHNVAGPPGGVTTSLVLQRSSAASAVVSIAGTRALQQLRFEHGISYGAYSIYEPLTPDQAHALVLADCLDEEAPAARDGLLGILRELAESGPTHQELQDDLEGMEAAASDPSELGGFLNRAASQELDGRPFKSPAEIVDERAQVTSDSAARPLAEAMATLLLTTPEGTSDVLSGFERYPLWSPRRVSGRQHRLRGLHVSKAMRSARMITSPEGISITTPDGHALTAFFTECVALCHWPDGTRGLWGEDGFYVEMNPQAWRGGDELTRWIDENVATELRVPMEPSLDERIASVETAAGDVKRSWLNSDELKALPEVLHEGEQVLVVAQAGRGLKVGVAAATDQRLLFLYFDNVLIDLTWAEIGEVGSEEATFLNYNSLTVEAGSETYKLSDIRPKERLAEFVSAIEAARQPG